MSSCTTLGITKQEVDFLQNSVGFPAVPANKVFYVSSVTGADMAGNGSDGSRDKPFKTLDYAIGQCTADKGDVIFLMPNHAETVSTASGITADVNGIFIYGLGSGETLPTFTFSATNATMVISAASVTAKNFIVKPSIDSVVSPIVVSGSDCDLDYEHQDASSTVEAVRSLLTTSGADRLTCKLKYIGFIAGNAVLNAIRLVGVDTARIWVDFYGVAAASIVEFHTTACHNIVVDGYFHNNGTSLTKNVVDTVTGSTWLATGWDGNSKSKFSGGTGVAIASDDVGAIAAAVAVIDEFHDVPAPDNVLNAQINEVIGNKADAGATGAVTTTDTLVAYIKQLVTAGIARDSILGFNTDYAERHVASGTDVMTNGDTIFTISGGPIEIVELVSICISSNDATASTLQYSANPTVGAATTFSGASASLANFAAGGAVVLNQTALSTAPDLSTVLVALGGVKTRGIIINDGIITLVIGTGTTTGSWKHYLRYKPLGPDVIVTGS